VRVWSTTEFPFLPIGEVTNVGKWLWGVYINSEVVMSCARDHRFRVWTRSQFFSATQKTSYIDKSAAAMTALKCDDKLAVVSSLTGQVFVYRPTSTHGWTEPERAACVQAHNVGVFSLSLDDRWLLTGAKDNCGASVVSHRIAMNVFADSSFAFRPHVYACGCLLSVCVHL